MKVEILKVDGAIKPQKILVIEAQTIQVKEGVVEYHTMKRVNAGFEYTSRGVYKLRYGEWVRFVYE